MSLEPATVAAALSVAGLVEVDASTRRRAEYSTDASLYRVPPLAVVWPRDGDDVAAVVEVARRLEVPVTLRGGGTSIAGNAVGPGIVVDTSRHLTRIGPVDPEARTVTVQPGVVLADLQRHAARHGLRFGPDPSTADRCTLGGMLGNDACGTRALGYGRTSDNVVDLQVLRADGTPVTAGPGTASAGAPVGAALDQLVADHGSAIRTHLGRFERQVSGYALQHLLPDRGGHVARALVGSEGTCAVTLGATVRLVPVPTVRQLVVLGYADMAAAADAVGAVRALRRDPTAGRDADGHAGVVAAEGIDRRIVDAVVARRGPAAVPPLPAGGGWLLVEVAGDDAAEVAALARRVADGADAIDHLHVGGAQAAALWAVRRDGAAWSSRTVAGEPAHAGFEDAAVPPEHLGDYLRGFEALLADHGLTTVPYGHLGDGCVHARIDLPLGERRGGADRGRAALRAFVTDAADLVARFGGSLSGEHGDGRARSELLARTFPPPVLDAFAAFEAAFDPAGLLNPGVLVRPRPVDADLRLPPVVAPAGGFAFPDDHDDLGEAVHRCIGVGACRADRTADGAVMCPSFLATGDERDSTRGRARVLQEVVDGRLVDGGFASPELHDSLDLCLSCKGCASDCPAGVDVATYKAETLHRTYAGRLRPRAHYVLGQLPRWLRAARWTPRVAGRLLDLPGAEPAARWVAGVDPRRPLPRPSPTPFSRAVRARPAPPDGRPPVLLWVDTFSDRFDPQVAVAAHRVLTAVGYRVEVPDRAGCCGLTWISTGQLDGARHQLAATVAGLAPWARAGVPIVGLEPPCLAVLRDDAARLLDGDEVAAVAASAVTLAELLSATPGWAPPDLAGTRVLAQPHCHHHAVLGWDADRALLTAAGAEVNTVGGCCGLAGDWGVVAGHHDVSVAVARTALLPAVEAAAPGTVLLADGFSCRTQLDHLAGAEAFHLAQLLDPGPAPAGLDGPGPAAEDAPPRGRMRRRARG